MPKFALIVGREAPSSADVPRDVMSEAFEVLRALGHSESESRRLLDDAMTKKKKYKDVEALLHAIYEQKQRLGRKAEGRRGSSSAQQHPINPPSSLHLPL